MVMKRFTYRLLFPVLLIAVAVALVLPVGAQPAEALEAYRAYQQQDLEKAAALIDKAIQSEAGKGDAMTWHIRGFVYKDKYNQEKDQLRDTPFRPTAIESFRKSLALDNKGEYRDNSLRSLQYLASTYYNDAVLIMREINPETIGKSSEYYGQYKALQSEIEPGFDFTERDVTFYKALATSNRKVYEKDRDKYKDFLFAALENYRVVLELDPDNYGANYNTAINLYNEGAYHIEQIDAEAQIPAIVKVQAESVELFREALPYLLKAYELDPQRRETLIALRGIYLSLNNNAEANKYRDLLEETQQTNK